MNGEKSFLQMVLYFFEFFIQDTSLSLKQAKALEIDYCRGYTMKSVKRLKGKNVD